MDNKNRYFGNKLFLYNDELIDKVNDWLNRLLTDIDSIKKNDKEMDPFLVFFVFMKLYCDDMLINMAKEGPEFADFIKGMCPNLSNDIKTLH